MKAFYIVLILFVTLVSIFAVVSFINKRNVKIVKKNSEQYKKITELNNKYLKIFITQQPIYYFIKECTSKTQYDNICLNLFFHGLVEQELSGFKKIFYNALFNFRKYNIYIDEYNAINSTITRNDTQKLRIPFLTFLKIEKELVGDSILKPVTTVSFKCIAKYQSRAGRNSYEREETFYLDELKKAIEYCQININYQATPAYQRSIMTDSLRYDILRRDGFRCQLCGATAKDGVKLHVDHIIPVSKGGKTEPSNLRTLCERCNLGKRDKIE